MTNERHFVETVTKELERRISEAQYRLRNGMTDREELLSSLERTQFEMRMACLHGIALMMGIQIGRDQILEEQAEERAKAARKRARKRKAKP